MLFFTGEVAPCKRRLDMSFRLALCSFIVVMCAMIIGIKLRPSSVQEIPPPPTEAPLVVTVGVPVLPRHDTVGIITSGAGYATCR